MLSTTHTKGNSLTSNPTELEWEVPHALKLPPDKLKARLDFFNNSIMLYLIESGVITAQHVSPDDVATSLLSVAQLFTGILPPNTLWHIRKELVTETAIYEAPRVRKVALVTKPLEPPERFTIPVPGLIFICRPSFPPRVFAVKSRPRHENWQIYHAPFFNVYYDGRTCAGTNKYPEDVAKIPESFFMSFFSLEVTFQCSKRHPDSTYSLWKELNGKKKYPTDDLIEAGKLKDII